MCLQIFEGGSDGRIITTLFGIHCFENSRIFQLKLLHIYFYHYSFTIQLYSHRPEKSLLHQLPPPNKEICSISQLFIHQHKTAHRTNAHRTVTDLKITESYIYIYIYINVLMFESVPVK